MPSLSERARRVRTVARNALLDLRYGEVLAVNLRLRELVRRPDTHNRFRYAYNSDAEALRRVFRGRIGPDDVLVDVGCGKGRVLNWWLAQGLTNRMVGLELDYDIARRTAERLARHPNVEVVAGDAVAHVPREATLLYVYNSFHLDRLVAFKERLDELRPAFRGTVLYYSPKEGLDVFESDPTWSVEYVDLGPAPLEPLAVLRPR